MTVATGPSAWVAIRTLAAVTLRRLVRGRAVWVSAVIAALPIVFAVAARHTLGGDRLSPDVFLAEEVLLAVLPALFIASSIGEDIEDKTTTYLWSRPLARWTILAGKLLALIPVAIALVVGSWVLAIAASGGGLPAVRTIAALAAGATASACVAAAIATLVPKQGMALAICYQLFVDLPIGLLPASLAQLSITHHVRVLAAFGDLESGSIANSAIGIAIVGGLWGALALWRIRRLEA